jgi:two-component system, sensor histidine kinase and response regulator
MYLIGLAFIASTVVVGGLGLLPPFVVSGVGTPLRLIVQMTATFLFLLSGSMLLRQSFRRKSALLRWYSLGLLLMALSNVGAMLQIVGGSPISWTARGAQYLGGAYLFVAALVILKEARTRNVPAEEAMAGLLKNAEANLKEKEAALQQSEERYRDLVESANSIIMRADGNLNITYMNEFGLKFFGYTAEEVLGKNAIGTTIPQRDTQGNDLAEMAMEILRQPEGFTANVHQNMRKNGELVWVSWTNKVKRNPDGTAEILAIGNDISALKKTEEALRESEARLRLAQDAARIVAWEYDPVTMKINFSENAEDVLEIPRRFENSNQGYIAIHPDDVEPHRALVTMAIETGGRYISTYRHAHGEQPIWLEEIGQAITDESGRTIRLVGVTHNITERKKAEAEIAYRATFPELNPNPIVELDTAGNVVYMNPAARTLFPNLTKLRVAHPFLVGWHALLSEIGIDETRIRDINVGGSWYEQAIAHVPSSKNLRIYARDITVRKKADELKDEFIGMVSHELKTPLTVIMGALATANDPRIETEQAKELLGDAVIHAGIMANMVDNLLELSRQQSDRLVLNTKPVDVNEVVQTVLENLRTKSESHHLVCDIQPKLVPAQADPLRFERIIYNLVDNAIKYSPDGGEVKVVTQQNGEFLTIGVIDQGPGISANDQARLFQSFERLGASVKGAIQGTGLGLRVCRILVEAHGGRIWVESEKGKGSAFFFTLPMSR